VASHEPAVGVFTPAGTCPGRLRRHLVLGDAGTGQNPSAVKFGSSRVRGRGLGRAGRGPLAGRRPDVGDDDQGVTVPGVMYGWEPRWEPRGRTIFQFSGLT
jgi:hypothetical protein